MPIKDGYAAAREALKDPRFEDLPLIAMTAHVIAGDAEKRQSAGMNDHVTKPIVPSYIFTPRPPGVSSEVYGRKLQRETRGGLGARPNDRVRAKSYLNNGIFAAIA